MKLYVRLFAVLLCAVMLFSMASCANTSEDVPVGTQIASCAGADYRLYVPTSWVVNTSYGISGAYRNLAEQSSVSVNTYSRYDYLAGMMTDGIDTEESAARIEWFWNSQCLAPIAARALNGEVTRVEEECVPTSLDGANAKQYRYSALVNGATLHFLQVVADHETKFYVFTFTATAEMFELYRSEADQMLKSFVFADPYEPISDEKRLDSGKDAPAGMKSAFGDDVAYCFYVPQSWVIRFNEQIYSAYVAEDKTSVSVVPYMPNADSMSVAEYFEMSRIMMEKTAGTDGYELISDTEKVDLGGREATVYEFRFRVGGVDYHYRQYIAAYKSMIYCLTYTATEDAFPLHLGELDAIVQAFQFR